MSPALKVFRKEVRELTRDKRLFSSAIFGPIFLIFLMLMLFGFLEQTLSKPKVRLFVVESGRQNPIITELSKSDTFQIQYVPNYDAGMKLVETGKAKLLVDLPASPSGPFAIKALYDPSEPTSQIAFSTFNGLIAKLNKGTLEAVLKEKGIPLSATEAIKIEETKIHRKEAGGATLIGFLPYLIVIWAFYGGFSIVSDLVAGEKEKQTLETLLISPISRTSVALGKLGALASVCLASSLTSLIGVMVVGMLNLPVTRGIFKNGFSIGPMAVLAILAALLPLVAMFASILLSISTFAKNSREAQGYLTLASFVVMMPAMVSQFIGFTDFAQARWISFVPVLNTAMVIREVLLGKFDGSALGITVGINIVLALIAFRWSIWLFNREQVLTRV